MSSRQQGYNGCFGVLPMLFAIDSFSDRVAEQAPIRKTGCRTGQLCHKTGLSSKDFIAPDSFTFKNGRMFQIGRTYGAMSFLQILAPELTDRMLADFLDLESSMVVTLHIQSIHQSTAIKNVKRKITDLQRMTIEEQKKAIRAGYDMLRPDRV